MNTYKVYFQDGFTVSINAHNVREAVDEATLQRGLRQGMGAVLNSPWVDVKLTKANIDA